MMSQRIRLRVGSVLLAGSIAIVGVPAQAQDDAMFGSTFMNGQMDNIRMDSLRRHMLDLDGGDTPRRAAKPGPPPRRPIAKSAAVAARGTTYRASPAVTARVREQFLKWIGQVSGSQGEKAMRQTMAEQDILAMWATQMRADGLRRGDLADAFTAYWVQNWQMANAVEMTPPAHVQAVRAQVAANLGAAGFTDAQRQELSEIYIYNQMIQGTGWIEAGKRGDRAMQRKLGDAAVARFRREMQVDLRSLKLSDAGFTSR